MKILAFCILLAGLFQKILTVCPTDKPYTYLTVCYAQCPWVPPHVTYLYTDSTCRLTCPGPLFFADDSTKSCVQICPNNPIKTYYDHTRQKCVQICSSNPSQFALQSNRSCLAQCPTTLYADDSTRLCVNTCPTGKFYQINGTSLRICTSKCYPNFYANSSQVCVDASLCPSAPLKLYGDDLSGLCVISCPVNSGTYAEESSRKCVQHCILGTFADPTTLKCVPTCPSVPLYYGSNTTRMCHLACIEGQFAYNLNRQCYKVCPVGFGDYSTRKCVDKCPQTNRTFADASTKLCISVCSPGLFADNDTRTCVSAIDCTSNLVGNPLTLQCISGQKCPVGYFIDFTIFMCVKRCSNTEFANLDTRVCGTTCPWNPPIRITFQESQSRQCLQQCPRNPRTFSDNSTQSCLSACPSGYFGTASNYDCVQTCPDGFFGNSQSKLCVSTCTTNTTVILYFYSPNISCVTGCPNNTYADNTTLTCVQVCPAKMFILTGSNTCVQKCPNLTFGDKFSGRCVAKCPAITQQYADDSTNLCVDVCPLNPDYFGQDLNDANRKCVTQCTNTDVFADPITRTCVKTCNRTKGYFGQLTSKRCHLKCPTGYGNPITNLCIAICPQSPIQTFGDNMTATCVYKCPNNTYGDQSTDICMQSIDCPTSMYGDDSTNLCISRCPVLFQTFGDPVTKKCVKSCQFSYFADDTTRLCTQTCNVTAKLFKDQSTRRCVLNCPQIPDLYNDPSSMACVPSCININFPYRYRFQNIRKCVKMCPSSPIYFADEQTKTCVLRCANLTFKFVNNTYRGCLSFCPPQVFNGTISTTLYEDNTTWACVSVCPPGFYAFKHPTNTTMRKCVRMCQIVAGVYYFADDISRSCVTQCPMKVHSTYGDRISFKCVKTCSRKQYRDQTTKQCVYNCQKVPIPYFADNSTWNCSKKCPVGTYAETINNTCVKQCPTNYFGYQQKCLTACPTGTSVYEDNTTWFCIDRCTTLPDYYSDSQNQKCVKNCTPGTFANNATRSCVVALQCSGTTVADPLTYRCVDRCSKVPMYFVTRSTNLCGPLCANSLFSYNLTNQCLDSCPTPYFGVNTGSNFYCTQICPTSQYKYINLATNFRICMTDCPTGYFAFIPKMLCVQVCPDGYFGRISTKLCVQGCSPLFSDDSTNLCVSTCPAGTTADSNVFTCKGRCKYGQFEQNKVCGTTCSAGLYANNLTRRCDIGCPEDPFTFADPFQKKCVFMCSPTYYGYFDNRTCLTSCPTSLFKQLGLRLCISPCLEGQVGDPQSLTCVASCSGSTYPFADPTSQKCVQLCSTVPDMYGHNNLCVDQCPLGKFAQNFTRTCVNICPNITASLYLNQSFADDLTRRCVRACSALSYAHRNITHNVCLNQCPAGFFASQLLQKCVLICPVPTFAKNGTKQCVSKCPNGQWGDTTTKVCMDGCYNNNYFSDNSTNMCVQKCPSEPDMYGKISTRECVLSCDTLFYSHPIERLCVADCLSPYYADPSSQLCVLTCPTHELQFADNHLRKCIERCRNYSSIIEYADVTTKKCLTSCPKSPKVLYGLNVSNTCQQSCPIGTFGDNDTGICLDKCIFQNPKFTWMDKNDNMCVKQCPLGYFSDNTTKICQNNCSVGTYADYSTRRCVVGCPVDPVTFATLNDLGHRVCAYTCKSGLYADQITRSCVTNCPILPFYYFHDSFKNSCQKQCDYPYFGQVSSQNCVLTCKQGFYGDLTKKKCQACRPQCVTCSAYLECLTCQIGFFLFQFECVTSCPSYPILYYSLQSSTKCFKTCPAPFYGLLSTKKCQLGCPLSFYPSDVTRLCTLCPTGCLNCESTGCITCYSGYTYLNSTRRCNQHCNQTHIYYFKNTCHLSCPDGSYLTNDAVNCVACNQQCATCVGAAANCTRCAQKFYYQGLCLDACPTDFFVNENMACISCKVVPQRCRLQPLTYKIVPFTQNYQQKAYVVFSRSVSMTLDEFISEVQIYMNGAAVKSNQFSAKIFNATTYVVTFASSLSLNENSLTIEGISLPSLLIVKGQSLKNEKIAQASQLDGGNQQQKSQLFYVQTSLNQNSISIGFKPGTIKDLYGNILTINKIQQKFEESTGLTQSSINASQKVSASTQFVTWIFLAILFLFFIKGGYHVLLCFEVVQILYMHIFLYANPMPFLQLKFLDSLKHFHFLFFPRILQSGLKNKPYQSIVDDVSLLANISPLIFTWLIVLALYLIFTILGNKKLIKNKAIRKFAKKIRKYRLRYQIIHDAFWVTFLYAVFFAMYQFKNVSFGGPVLIANFVFAILVLIIYSLFTFYILKLGKQYKDTKAEDIPRKFRFIVPEASTFPMEIPLRYLRKILLCLALAMPAFEAQVVIMMMVNFVFLCYYMCYMPATSKITNYLNLSVQTGYILIEGLFYGYFKLIDKTAEEQEGFAIVLICVEVIIMVVTFAWMAYRFVEVVKTSDAWKYVHMKLTQNTDPQFLKEEQRKRDLQFDFGSLQNKSQNEISDDLNISSKNLNFKKPNKFQSHTIFEQQTKVTTKKKEKKKEKKITSNSQISISQDNSIFQRPSDQDLLNEKMLAEKLKVLKTNETRVKSPYQRNRDNFLKIDEQKIEQDLEQIIIIHQDIKAVQKANNLKRGAWDDLEFDQNQI